MHIVIVDSSRVVLKVVAGLLEPRGHVLHLFTDSSEALDCIAKNPSVRALITSLEVRPMTGLELCWSVRSIADANRPLSIIMMSSGRNVRNLVEALDSGADDFIEKPLKAEELHARLRAAERLTSMQADLIRLANTDSLTGLLNRRAFMGRAESAAELAGPYGRMAAIIADIDHFKRVNDTYGHDVGDGAIRAIADLIGQEGIAGRLGGEEFAVILPGRTLAEASVYANRLRLRATDLRIRSSKGPVQITCSFGVSEWSEGETIEGLVKRADIALYEAKTTGRNRVISAATEMVLARAS